MTGLLDTLEQSGLVKRIHDEKDRRSVQVRLTEAGTAHLDKFLPNHFRRLTAMMVGLSKSEQETLIALLEKIEAALPAVLSA
jgi:DNA-binding MarR family transcriptional regulator